MSSYEAIKEKLRAQPHTWLVTGCAGFIGSHIAETLLRLGQHVVGLDNLLTGYQKNIDYLTTVASSLVEKNPEYTGSWTSIHGDIRSADDVKAAFFACAGRRIDFVLHQAALGSVPRSIEDPMLSHDVNVNGFLQIMNAARDHQVSGVVYASSSSVYGDAPELPKVEDKMGSLLSPYAATKRIDEVYAQTWAKAYGVSSVGLRYFNVFGPRQDPNGAYAAVIPRWVAHVLDGVPCELYGDGEISRDFCYVDNVVQANILAAFSQKQENPQTLAEASSVVYNVACAERTTLAQLHSAICDAVAAQNRLPAQYEGKKPTLVVKPARAGDIKHSLADIQKVHDEIGYVPSVSFAAGIHLTVAAW